MAQNITPLIAGNWKMNGLRANLFEVERLATLLAEGESPRCSIAICPPATLIAPMNRITSGSSKSAHHRSASWAVGTRIVGWTTTTTLAGGRRYGREP